MPDRFSNLWISADLLIWSASEDGFSCQYGKTTINTTIVNSRPTTAISEKDEDIDFRWRPGFRVGMGADWPCSGWDVGAYWTYIHLIGRAHHHHNRALWSMYYNTGDAVFGRKFWVGHCVNLKPFAGLRYAQISQRLLSSLQTNIIAATGQSIVTTTMNDRQKFWGLGPELGLEANFYFSKNWSLYGNLSGAILYGHTTATFDDKDSFALTDNICNATSTSGSNQTVLDFGLGVRWEVKHFTFQAGLEDHNYFGFNHIACSGNLNLYGANVSAAVHF